jgi:hypothetical protein
MTGKANPGARGAGAASAERLSAMFAPILTGWQQYYGRFHGSALKPVWRHMNLFLARWLMRKHKRLVRHKMMDWSTRKVRGQAGRQPVQTLEPHDLRELFSAPGQRRWTNMAEATRTSLRPSAATHSKPCDRRSGGGTCRQLAAALLYFTSGTAGSTSFAAPQRF